MTLKIKSVDPGWLETRLNENHMDLLWSCIEKEVKNLIQILQVIYMEVMR